MISRKHGLVLGIAGALLALGALAAGAYAHRSKGSGSGSGYGPSGESAVVSLASSHYGPVLVLGGNGAGLIPGNPATSPPTPPSYKYPPGSSLYFPTIDPPAPKGWYGAPYEPGCLTTLVEGTVAGTVSCTGPETDEQADWPALTTAGKPVAGPGVDPHLLGTVYRADLGTFQVTYAGHPLYLFTPVAGLVDGANLLETVLPLPPWHTAWFLVSPRGLPASGPAHLETEEPHAGTSYSSNALATEMLPEVEPEGAAVTVYSFSRDRHGQSRCEGACERDFIPVFTVGTPTAGKGVNASRIGVTVRRDGSEQVTYDGHPLYIYSQEQPLVEDMELVTTGTAGNGNDVHAFGGTFNVVTP
jgi:predicted lipoprotein with Yx(FWY)xxD motif